MIIATKVTKTGDTSYKVDLFADSKNEVIPSADIKGLPVGATISPASSCMTANGEVAFMKSDGTWNWL